MAFVTFSKAAVPLRCWAVTEEAGNAGVSCGPLGPLPHQPTPLRIRFTKNPGATRRCRLQGACRVSHVIRSGPRGRGGLCRVLGAPLSVDRPSPFKVSSS